MARIKKESGIIPQVISFLAGRFRKKRPFNLPGDVVNSVKLLVIGSGDILEILFVRPVIDYFARHYPGIKKTILVEESQRELAANLLPVESVLTYRSEQLSLFNRGFVKLLGRIKREYFESCILLGRDVPIHRYIIALSTGASARIGFASRLSFPYLNCEIQLSGGSGYRGKSYTGIISSIGLKPEHLSGNIQLIDKDFHRARQLIHFRKPQRDTMTIGVDPGKGREKEYVIPEILAFLVNNLAARMKSRVLVLTEPPEKKLIKDFYQNLKCERFDLEPENSYETVNLIGTCDLFVSANTGLFHYAAALGIPSVGLFTENESENWVPERDNVRIFRGKKGKKLSLNRFFNIVESVLK